MFKYRTIRKQIYLWNASIKEKEMLDISAFEVNINSRPDWCPKNKVINIINNLSEENKVLVDRMCDGFSAMFELMNNQKDGN